MGIAVIQPGHHPVPDNPHANGHHKEKHRVEKDLDHAAIFASPCAQNTGQHDNADHIVNDRRTDDGRAQESLERSQLLKGCHRDGDAGGCHDGTDKQGTVKLRAAHGGKAIERAVKQGAAHQRNGHAHAGDQRCNGTCLEQLPEIGAKAGGKHQQNHANLGKGGNAVAELNPVEHTGTYDQAGEDFAHHLRGLAFARRKAEQFGRNQYDCQIFEKAVHKNASFPNKAP